MLVGWNSQLGFGWGVADPEAALAGEETAYLTGRRCDRRSARQQLSKLRGVLDLLRVPVVRLGIHFVNFTLRGGAQALAPTLSAAARAAEQGGSAKFTLMDHWFQMEQFASARDPMLEGYTRAGDQPERTRSLADLGGNAKLSR